MASLSMSGGFEADTADRLRPVRRWLYVLALMVLLMVVLGGLTRLTDSGLSITSWKPISGILPPISASDWQAEFDAYKQIPEYSQLNSWMALADFQRIFWLEWGHRLFGRVIGLAFLVPFAVFLFQRRLDRRLAPGLALLFVAGGFQGLLGWWMVSSGLSERVDVSQYRLAAHLSAALVLFLAIIWFARTLEGPGVGPKVSSRWRASIWGLAALIGVQIAAGGFVAGLDAGQGYNTWPLMEGRLVPEGLWSLSPWWTNLFESALTVQFMHRSIAYLVTFYALVLVAVAFVRNRFEGVHLWIVLIGGLVGLQVFLGISTLLSQVSLPLALGHQALAFMLAGVVVAYASDLGAMR